MEHVVNGERAVDTEEIFFSVTNAEGVITGLSSTLTRLSGYPREELIGAPHNILRHKAMPAGLFRLMWDDLAKGLPVCAYVINRAKDEADYRLFSVVMPVGEDFLAVYLTPQDIATSRLIEVVYDRVRAHEAQQEADGAEPSAVSESGATELTTALAPFGYSSLLDMTRTAAPAELRLLTGAAARVPEVAEATGPLATVLELLSGLESDTEAMVRQIDDYTRLLGSLSSHASEPSALSQRVQEIQVGISSVGSTDPESSASRTGERVSTRMQRATTVLEAVPEQMSRLRDHVVALRFLVSQVRLLTLATGRFTASTVTGGEEEPVAMLRVLSRALEENSGRLAGATEDVRTSAAQLDASMRDLVRELDGSQRPLSRWIRTVSEEGAESLSDGVDCDEVLKSLTALAEKGFPEAGGMAVLAAECRGLELSFDTAVVEGRFPALREQLDAYAENPEG